METARTGSAVSDPGKPARCGTRVAGGNRLGLGVLLAFTVKGIFTTAAMCMALLAPKLEEGYDVLPYVLACVAVCIGGCAALGRTHRAGTSEEPKPAGQDSPA